MIRHHTSEGTSRSGQVVKVIAWALLVVLAVMIARFVASVDFGALGELLQETPVMLPMVVLMSLLSYMCSVLAWSLCLSGGGGRTLPFAKLFAYRLIGDMLGPFNPTGVVAGDTVRTMLLKRDGFTVEHALSSVLTHRVLVILSDVLLTIVSIVYVLARHADGGTGSLAAGLGLGAGMGLLFYFLIRLLVHPRLLISRGLDRLARRTHLSFLTEERIGKVRAANLEASRFFRHDRRLFDGAMALCVVHWFFGAMEFFVIFAILGLEPTLMGAMAVEMGVGVFKALGSIVPGQLGVEEYGNKVMLDIVGVESNEVWLVASLMRRGRQLFWLATAGLLSLVCLRPRRRRAAQTDTQDD